MVDVFFQAQLLKKYTRSNLTKVTKQRLKTADFSEGLTKEIVTSLSTWRFSTSLRACRGHCVQVIQNVARDASDMTPTPLQLFQSKCYVDPKKALFFPVETAQRRKASGHATWTGQYLGHVAWYSGQGGPMKGFLDNIFGYLQYCLTKISKVKIGLPLYQQVSEIRTFLLSDKVTGEGLRRGKPKLSLQNWKGKGIMTRCSSNLPTQKNTVLKGIHLSHLKIFWCIFFFPLKA